VTGLTVKKIPHKIHGLVNFTDESYQIFKEELTLIVYKLLPKIEKEEHFPCHSVRLELY
jgi:hypothetical protein